MAKKEVALISTGGNKMKRLILICFTVVGIWFFASTTAMAIHKGSGDLVCGGCHTMHNSQGGSELGGNTGGSLVMLRGAVTSREQIHNFCLQCHSSDGAQATSTFAPHSQSAPKVLLHSGTANKWTQASFFNIIGGGGDFQYACGDAASSVWDCATVDGATALGKGHSLGASTVAPPGNTDGTIAAFTCTSCHDPHGTDSALSADINKFRNLRKIPTGSGSTSVALTAGDHLSWVGGITGLFSGTGNFTPVTQATGAALSGATLTAIWPVYRGNLTGTAATDSANSNAYGGGAAGISRWCSTCHDNWHEGLTAGNIAGGQGTAGDWKRHPVDNILDEGATNGQSGAGVDIFDPTNYVATTAGQVLPVASAQAANKVFYTTAGNATTDKVMCLSCHFAHGGPYNDNLRWDYTSAVGAGTQSGNGVPSTKGCQLCHNRGA